MYMTLQLFLTLNSQVMGIGDLTLVWDRYQAAAARCLELSRIPDKAAEDVCLIRWETKNHPRLTFMIPTRYPGRE